MSPSVEAAGLCGRLPVPDVRLGDGLLSGSARVAGRRGFRYSRARTEGESQQSGVTRDRQKMAESGRRPTSADRAPAAWGEQMRGSGHSQVSADCCCISEILFLSTDHVDLTVENPLLICSALRRSSECK